LETSRNQTTGTRQGDPFYRCVCGSTRFQIEGRTIVCGRCEKRFLMPLKFDEQNGWQNPEPKYFNQYVKTLEIDKPAKPGVRYKVKQI